MRPSAVCLLGGLLAAGCASDAGGGKTRKSQTPTDPYAAALMGGPPPGYKPGSGPIGGDSDGDPEMVVDNEVGVLEQSDVEPVIRKRWREFTRCYDRAGDAQRYAGGKVMLRFLITSAGAVADVLVVESQLGHFEVERCLADTGRKLKFPRPAGNKGTTFDYPVEFRSSGELDVVEWPPARIEKELAALLPQLAPCGALAARPVEATLYIEPGGAVGAVGLSAKTAVDVNPATCAVEQIRAWKLPGEAGNRVARTTFTIR